MRNGIFALHQLTDLGINAIIHQQSNYLNRSSLPQTVHAAERLSLKRRIQCWLQQKDAVSLRQVDSNSTRADIMRRIKKVSSESHEASKLKTEKGYAPHAQKEDCGRWIVLKGMEGLRTLSQRHLTREGTILKAVLRKLLLKTPKARNVLGENETLG